MLYKDGSIGCKGIIGMYFGKYEVMIYLGYIINYVILIWFY